MSDLGYSAIKRSPEKHLFAFALSSLPNPDDVVIDGDSSEGEIDGNA
ncbi:gp017 [Rhodococcus phage ReqiPoco6]|uniref:Gp017 n=1 Tax=Rhodococcus phage ReqiPoco6 TaxID=691964 RepID=D4P7N5_9CAUD|nr:gp017 [Rhodococcus phage ReqiPoco6]ADD81015.1 gp017 [Rhodococcus phage ReqiPoco6]